MTTDQQITVEWRGDEVAAELREAARKGLALAMEHLLQVADERVPIQEGTLMRSGTASTDDTELVGQVGFSAHNDRDNYDYAVRQHEDLTLSHAPGRSAKYLEWPALDEADKMSRIIAQAIREASGRAGIGDITDVSGRVGR